MLCGVALCFSVHYVENIDRLCTTHWNQKLKLTDWIYAYRVHFVISFSWSASSKVLFYFKVDQYLTPISFLQVMCSTFQLWSRMIANTFVRSMAYSSCWTLFVSIMCRANCWAQMTARLSACHYLVLLSTTYRRNWTSGRWRPSWAFCHQWRKRSWWDCCYLSSRCGIFIMSHSNLLYWKLIKTYNESLNQQTNSTVKSDELHWLRLCVICAVQKNT